MPANIPYDSPIETAGIATREVQLFTDVAQVLGKTTHKKLAMQLRIPENAIQSVRCPYLSTKIPIRGRKHPATKLIPPYSSPARTEEMLYLV